MDLTELQMEYEEEKKYYVLSFTWAIIAACDIQSEFLRFLGEIRYTIIGVWKLISRQHFEAKFKFNGEQVYSNNFNELIPTAEFGTV